MTVAYNTAPLMTPARRPGVLAAIGGILSLLDRSIAAAHAYGALDQLSDAQLAQRGLTRPDIASVAMKVLLDEA